MKDGFDAWSFGAQKGLYQPPYVVKWRGRWYRTHPLSAPAGEPYLHGPDLEKVRALGRLPFGGRLCMDALIRTNRHFNMLPLLPIEKLP